jgi:L-threonylcarbamoyladenylate synthase
MKNLLLKFGNNLIRVFVWPNTLWHVLAIALTYCFVVFGFDWYYFSITRSLSDTLWMPAGMLGFLLPVFVPIILYVIGKVRHDFKIKNTALALIQAVILGSFISSLYKAFTGRIPPEFNNSLFDISNGFRFGFLEGGIFWGWPSSHTTVAFAFVITLCVLYPKNYKIKYLSLLSALYIGLGASIGFHWFSEFAAGVIIGSVIGTVVGKSFLNIFSDEKLIKTLKQNKVAVMPTDTIYGIVGRAENRELVERIYSTRKRAPHKPCIILIGEIDELQKFSIKLSVKQKSELVKYWPGPVSIIFDVLGDSLEYLHRGTKTLAFRLPLDQELRNLLLEVGPLIAPSANIEGLNPSTNIKEAKKYFEDLVDLYVDKGEITGRASKIIKLHADGSISVIRE